MALARGTATSSGTSISTRGTNKRMVVETTISREASKQERNKK